MAEGTLGVVLGTDLDVAAQLRWAVRLAEARSLDLLILQYVESREGKTVEVSLDEPLGEKTTPVARQIMDFIELSRLVCISASGPTIVRIPSRFRSN